MKGLDSDRTAPAFPVLLYQLADEPKDIEIFRYRGKSLDKSTARDFALELFSKIQAKLAQTSRTLEDDLRTLFRHEGKFVDSSGSSVSLEREIDARKATKKCDALTFLDEWLTDPEAPYIAHYLASWAWAKPLQRRSLPDVYGNAVDKAKVRPFRYFWICGMSVTPPSKIRISTRL
jgi:hypothetical protein